MNHMLKAWNASFVRRWHTQPELCDTIDYDSGHQQRCTILLLLFWPDSSRDSIIDCITHDQGECDSGDIARPAKRKHPELRTIAQTVEDESIIEQKLNLCNPTEEEIDRRKFVDLLDSYIWMLRHKPTMAAKVEWNMQYQELLDQAEQLGVYNLCIEFLASSENFYI